MAENNIENRIGTVGGEAVIEGVMMRAGNRIALSVRDTSGNIKTEISNLSPIKSKFLKLPLIRGVVNFLLSMKMSIDCLNRACDMLGIEDEETKFSKWLSEKFGKSITAVASAIGTVLGIALSLFLFMYIPTACSKLIFGTETEGGMRILKSVFQGVFKIAIFLCYVSLVSLLPDIKRVFQYHGAEHKSIFCHEAYLELTVENVKAQSRFHPRCGTSFLVVMMIIGIISSFFLVNLPTLPQVICKIITLPLVVGLGYEFIKYAGKHDNIFVKILSAPGLWIQRITTKEPDEQQMEVAIHSLKAALPDIYPEVLEELDGKKCEDENNVSSEN